MTNTQEKGNKIALKVIIVFLFFTALTITISCEDNELSDFEEVLVNQDDTADQPDDQEMDDDSDDDQGNNDDDQGDNSNLVTYENTARSIIDTNCIECHNINNAEGGVRLENFANAFNEANTGRMIDRMTDPNSPMPPSGNLPDSVIQDIMDWIEDGLLEN